LDLRKARFLGVRLLQSELLRNYDVSLSMATINKYYQNIELAQSKNLEENHYERPLLGIDYQG